MELELDTHKHIKAMIIELVCFPADKCGNDSQYHFKYELVSSFTNMWDAM